MIVVFIYAKMYHKSKCCLAAGTGQVVDMRVTQKLGLGETLHPGFIDQSERSI